MELCRLPTWFVLLAVLGLSAGAAAFDSPEAAVETAMRYFAVHDFQGYISVMDPEVVREFNEFIMFVLSQMPEDMTLRHSWFPAVLPRACGRKTRPGSWRHSSLRFTSSCRCTSPAP